MTTKEQENICNLLNNGIIKDTTINFGHIHVAPKKFPNNTLELKNCHLTAKDFILENIINEELSVRFIDCKIESQITFKDCKIHKIDVKNSTLIDSSLIIKDSQINECFISDSDLSQGILQVNNTTCYSFAVMQTKLLNLEIKRSSFKTVFNYSYNEAKSHGSETFYKCSFYEVIFFSNIFSNKVAILSSIFQHDISFRSNQNKIFDLTIFNSTIIEKSYFDRIECTTLKLYNTKFLKEVSFQGANFEKIILNKIIFNDIVFFDDIKITKIFECDRKTLRTIKQQLQKAENKIDYNRFRAYELAAYYKELKFHKNFVDKSILGLTILFTGYNYNWFRALTVTILTGMLFYSILYFIEFYTIVNPENENNFTAGAFRFFLVTDFFSPFLDRKYLNNGYSWTIFVLGKIFIAFGIYEMIQAFRKFKA